MNHRALQRTLFRMQIDPAFCAAIVSADEDALASTDLGLHERALLAAADPRGIRADQGGKRRLQVLGNATSEYALTLAAAAQEGRFENVLADFAASRELHRAVIDDQPLAIAFGDFALRLFQVHADASRFALATLERELALLRRGDAPHADASVPKDALGLAAGARVLRLAAGTHALAAELRAALDAGTLPERISSVSPSAKEAVLLSRVGRRPAFGLAEVRAEPLDPPADGLFLRLSDGPLSVTERAEVAQEAGASAADLEAFLQSFVDEGVLRRG